MKCARGLNHQMQTSSGLEHHSLLPTARQHLLPGGQEACRAAGNQPRSNGVFSRTTACTVYALPCGKDGVSMAMSKENRRRGTAPTFVVVERGSLRRSRTDRS